MYVRLVFPEAANARVKALRQVFEWAVDPEAGLATVKIEG